MNYREAVEDFQRIRADEMGRKDVFTIAFCGVFSSGKSSILNYLLQYKDFSLPVGIVPVTKLVTKIRYGEQLAFYCAASDGSKKHQISRAKFEAFVLEKEKIPSGYNEMEICIPAEILKTGVVFLDTPGFLDEMGGELEEMSRRAVLKSDMVIFCTSAAQLGHQFEKEYIEELEESIGNYCMIVNHMDCCNTERDVDDIIEVAQRLMKEKGGNILNNLLGRSFFFTVAAGKLKNMNGFDDYIAYILQNTQLKQNLKVSTTKKIEKFRKKKLAESVCLELQKEKEEWNELCTRHNKILDKKKFDRMMQKNELEKERNAKIRIYRSELESEIGRIEKDLEALKKDNVISEFVEKARGCILNRMMPLAKKIQKEMNGEKKSIEVAEKFQKKISNLGIPSPEKTRVQRRSGFLERATETVGNFLYGIFEIDDGYEYVYLDYHIPAVNVVKTKLKPELEDVLIKAITHFYDLPDAVFLSGLENRLKEQEESMRKWEQLLKRCKA